MRNSLCFHARMHFDLVRYNRNDLLKFRNFGKKSLTELDDLLASNNLHFGMDVSIYKLDKE